MQYISSTSGTQRGGIGVGVVDADEFALAYLLWRVSSVPGVVIEWSTDSGDEAVRRCTAQKVPDVVLMGMGQSGMQGMGVCRTIRAHNNLTSLVLFAPVVTAEHLQQAVESGAQGMFTKRPNLDIAHIVQLAATCKAMQEEFRSVNEAYHHLREQPVPRQWKLSRRESMTLELVSRGMDMRQIAEHMGVKTSTVKTFATRAIHKLGVQTLRQAVAVWTESAHFVVNDLSGE